MAKISIWSNYEVVNGIKVFGAYHQVKDVKLTNDEPISDFDAAKDALWNAYDDFRNSFNYPTDDGTIYDFSRTEMDLVHDDKHEYFGAVEGFIYDDSVTQWDAMIYENDEM